MRRAVAVAALLASGACQQAPAEPETGIFSGVFRNGFEQSHFYPVEPAGGGPWWMTIESEDDHVRLESYARGEGRGRAVVVHVTVEGDLRGPVDFGFLLRFAQSLHVTGIVYAEPVSDDAFMAVVEATRACASQSG